MSIAVYDSGLLIADVRSFSDVLRKYRVVISLVMLILSSAFGVIYVTNVNRQLVSQLEQLQTQRNSLYMQWSQLLLEKSTLTGRLHIADVAKTKLGMIVPVKPEMFVIEK